MRFDRSHLFSDPFWTFSTGKPEGGSGMAGMIGASFFELKVAQEWIPDSFCKVCCTEGGAF